MSVLYETIKNIDDDYLTGLSNKGTVKRAYKDLEGMNVEPVMSEDRILFDFDGTQCEIKMPLSESTCSCPQVGTCRHIVTLILAAKRKLDKENAGQIQEKKTDEIHPENIRVNDIQSEGEKADAGSKRLNEKMDLGKMAMKEIAEFPIADIFKKLSAKILSSTLEKIRSNILPRITKSQIITVENDSDESIVKLMHPLSASGCSCHKQGFCPHKLKALLYVKVSEKMTELSEIEKFLSSEEEQTVAPEQIEATGKKIKNMLTDLFTAGLARLSPGMKDRFFELALTCHNSGMANAENFSRELGNLIEKYQSKSAEISNVQMMEKTVEVFLNKDMVGEFRSEYSSVRDLYLVGLGARSFRSSAGYAGESIYFIEKNTGEYYTYTNAKADFYEGIGKAGAGAISPWNLGMSFKGLVGGSIRMYYGKINKAHRLSSSVDTKAEMAGSLKADAEDLKKFVYKDFSDIWKDYFETDRLSDEEEYSKLVMIKPENLRDIEFDKTTQRLKGFMVDNCGREISVSLQYKKEEAAAIRSLEKMAERLERKGTKPPVFLGMVYISDERVMFYPIETVDELSETYWEQPAAVNGQTEANKEAAKPEINEADIGQILAFLKECRTLLSDIFTSGLSVIPGYLSERLSEAKDNASKYGLLKLSELLNELYMLLEQGRHGMEEKEEVKERKVQVFCRIAEYVRLGIMMSGRELAGIRLNSGSFLKETDQ